MASGVKCRVRLERFVPDLAGYTACKDQDGVQALLAARAERIRASADSALGEPGHKVSHKRGKFDMGYFVSTDTAHAARAQSKRKTLTKAAGAAGG